MSNSADAASALAEAFFRAVPPDRKKRTSEAEWVGALQRFHRDADKIKQRYALGLLGRARAAFGFQRRLLAAGFDADTVRKVVFSLVLGSMSGKR